MKRRAMTAAAAIVALGLASANADDLDRGVELFERGEFDAAADVLSPLAAGGDSTAQYVLGMMYLNSMVEAAAPSEAHELIEAAAEAGHLAAQTELARMYRDGDGVEQDMAAMMRWYERAAEQGDVGAQLFVADGYGYGYGVEPDLVEAYKWYEIAIQYWGALAVRARDMLAEKMTEEQVAEGVRRAAAWNSAHPAPKSE